MRCTVRIGKFIENHPIIAVNSVYRKTINLQMGDEIVALCPESIPLTPMSVILPLDKQQFSGLAASACRTEQLIFGKNTVETREGSWKMGQVSFWDPIINKELEKEQELYLKTGVRQFLKSMGNETGGFGNMAASARFLGADFAEGKTNGKIEDRIKEALHMKLWNLKSCEGSDIKKLACISSDMIGLGIGLTPSGDDFLVGMLLAFWIRKDIKKEDFEIFVSEIKKKLENTNQISRQYLLCACHGEYGELFHRLIDDVYEGREITEDLEQIQIIGHSSGTDMLNGILTGLELCKGGKRWSFSLG